MAYHALFNEILSQRIFPELLFSNQAATIYAAFGFEWPAWGKIKMGYVER
jgi:hypothetical protein